MPMLFSTTTTAQQVINSTAQDVRNTLTATDPTNGQLTMLDYVDRVSKEMLRASRWVFLLSPSRQFYTKLGCTDYWIGPLGGAPFTAVDVGTNITDLRIIKPKSVFDRSNFTALGHVDEAPLNARLAYPDAQPRLGRPAVWRQDEANPNILSIYPAADNQNTYSPQPISPICSLTSGGSLPNRIYYLTTTYVDSFGNESTAPQPTEMRIPAGQLVTVNPPESGIDAVGIDYGLYNVYAASANTLESPILDSNSTSLQATSIDRSTTWTEPSTGLITGGPPPPTNNKVNPITGYLMEFRYYQQRAPVTSPSQILQIPDDYKDVVISGVNALTFDYLMRAPESQKWYAIYKDGITQMIRDINFMAKGGEYVQPDAATIGQNLPAVETIDLSYLTT